METLRMPWEVIERVIDQSRDHTNTLRSFSLTCRQLHSHSRCVMFARVSLTSGGQAFAFVEFLQDNPHLKPFVHSITFHLDDFAPFPLVHTLPNVSEIKFTSVKKRAELSKRSEYPTIRIHQSSLICLQRFGANIRTLCLSDLSFATPLLFGRVLLAFPRVINLTCKRITMPTRECNGAPLEVIWRRISEQIRLKTLTIGGQRTGGPSVERHVAGYLAFLINSVLATSTVETLELIYPSFSQLRQHSAHDWSRLRSLVLKWRVYEIDAAVNALTAPLPNSWPTLREVIIELQATSIIEVARALSRPAQHPSYEKLERALLKFPQPRIKYLIKHSLHAQSASFWLHELGEYMPMLSQRSALTLTPETVLPAGHDCGVCCLVASPDSKWIATGSADSTVILWDSSDGSIVQQWVAHGYTTVKSLAFSPDSRHLASCGTNVKMAVWNLSDPVQEVAVLPLWFQPRYLDTDVSCAWSPDGSIIVTTSYLGTVTFWDAHTFRRLGGSQTFKRSTNCIAFSPDGRWLAHGFEVCAYGIMDVASIRLHKSIDHGPRPLDSHFVSRKPTRAGFTFDPGSKRLATGRGPVTLWDVETGETLLVLGDQSLGYALDIQFSPDGKLVLVALDEGPAYMHVWDASSGVALLQLKGHTDVVWEARFSPCGEYVASASADRTVRLWRLRDGCCVATFSEHQSGVSHLAFSPDGRTLSSGDEDGTVIIRCMDGIIPVDDMDPSA